MKSYFVQVVNARVRRDNILLSGAVMAENKEEAERIAIETAKQYKAVKEYAHYVCHEDMELSLYTLIELDKDKPCQLAVHKDR